MYQRRQNTAVGKRRFQFGSNQQAFFSGLGVALKYLARVIVRKKVEDRAEPLLARLEIFRKFRPFGNIGVDAADSDDFPVRANDREFLYQRRQNTAVGKRRFQFGSNQQAFFSGLGVALKYLARVIVRKKVEDRLAGNVDALGIEPFVPQLVGLDIVSLRVLDQDRRGRGLDQCPEAVFALPERCFQSFGSI